MKLSTTFVSNGKWHLVQVDWNDDQVQLSVDYDEKDVIRTHFTIVTPLIQLINIGGEAGPVDPGFEGCLQGTGCLSFQISCSMSKC